MPRHLSQRPPLGIGPEVVFVAWESAEHVHGLPRFSVPHFDESRQFVHCRPPYTARRYRPPNATIRGGPAMTVLRSEWECDVVQVTRIRGEKKGAQSFPTGLGFELDLMPPAPDLLSHPRHAVGQEDFARPTLGLRDVAAI